MELVEYETPGQTIPAATQERVRAAAETLGYRPHGLARALREGHSRVVLLDIGSLQGGRALERFIAGMDAELATHGYSLLVLPGESSGQGREEVVRALRPHAVLDLASVYAARSEVEDGGWVDGLAAHTLTQLAHLAERGHHSIAFALPADAGTDSLPHLRWRFAQEAGRRLAIRELPPLWISDRQAGGAGAAITRMREEFPDVTAIAGYDDETALSVLAAMTDIGLTAPHDLAVIGFDDSRFGALWRPALTTVRIEGAMFGRRAARSILRLAAEQQVEPSATVVVRSTT